MGKRTHDIRPAGRPSGNAADHSTHSTRSTSHSASRPDSAHSTGVGSEGRWSTKRIAMYALFVALAMATSFIEFPIFPAAPWLKYDPSGIVCLVAGFAFGPSAAAIVSVLGFLPHLFIDPWGTLMAVVVALGLSVPAAAVYRRHRSRAGAVAALAVGTVVALVAAIVCNLFVTPVYAHMTVAQVAAMIVPVLLPFNLLKFAIHDIVTFVIYKPISNLVGD
ncbi:ECF transporter S component [Bifidobacterium choloepi]|nr:ECF transporter S component [Bifidobacterium choloepi]